MKTVKIKKVGTQVKSCPKPKYEFSWQDPNSLYHRAYSKPDKIKYNGRYKSILNIRDIVRNHGIFEELNPSIDEKEKELHRLLLNNIAKQCTEIYEFLETIDTLKNVPKNFARSFGWSISKLSIFSLHLGGFTGMIPDFHFKEARRKGTEPGLRAKKKTINLRQKIIKATYPDREILSRTTVKTVIRKCKDKFIKAEIKRFSEPTINRDIKIILSE